MDVFVMLSHTMIRVDLFFYSLLLALHSYGADITVNGFVLKGTTDDAGITSFRGVPFAAPPVGDLRWRAPQPLTGNGEVVEDEFAAACAQGDRLEKWYRSLIASLGEDPAQFDGPAKGYEEDCLYLNVWTNGFEEPKPVMVWIYGGANVGGWSYEPNYRGHNLAQQEVVVVSLAYRLGIFGFLADARLDTDDVASGNYGLLDLIAGLQWVREHIHKFGGDPGNVTIFGESAGATNIAYLIASPKAAGLFHKAIHQSAGYAWEDPVKRKAMLEYSRTLFDDMSAEEMRALPADQLLEMVAADGPASGFGPVVDGNALTAPLSEAFSEQAGVPLMIGTNTNEWLMYLDPAEKLSDTLSTYEPAQRALIQAELEGLSESLALDRYHSSRRMHCPSDVMARVNNAPSYLYRFTKVRPGEFGEEVGAYHGAEIPYVFGTHDEWLPTDDVDRGLTRVIQDYWVNFARTGNPNGGALPEWGVVSDGVGVMELGASSGMIAFPEVELCRLLEVTQP